MQSNQTPERARPPAMTDDRFQGMGAPAGQIGKTLSFHPTAPSCNYIQGRLRGMRVVADLAMGPLDAAPLVSSEERCIPLLVLDRPSNDLLKSFTVISGKGESRR